MHKALGVVIIIIATLGVGYGQSYVLSHLPFIDCLPYKTGNDIIKKMKLPAGAVADSISIQMEFEKGGKSYLFDANHFPDNFDSTYVYKSRKEVVIQKGNGLKAAIDEFSLNSIETKLDTSKALFNTSTPYVLVFTGLIQEDKPWDLMLNELHKKYKQVYIVTADKATAIRKFQKEQVLIGDITMIKTAARVWPTIFVMNGSTIMQKQSYIDFLKK